ncbi:hypothetical protein [Commensalibacter sp. Nvir]|uniref:hypothetical protein n=1 Tax=Commensalibacter sp. Nvir TaxID=3069817 RepID=UPI0030C8308A
MARDIVRVHGGLTQPLPGFYYVAKPFYASMNGSISNNILLMRCYQNDFIALLL